jgi:hypothetical protein
MRKVSAIGLLLAAAALGFASSKLIHGRSAGYSTKRVY